MRLVFEPLDKNHDRENFDCGAEELNRFLKEQANQRQKRHNAITHVAVDIDSKSTFSAECGVSRVRACKIFIL